MGGGIHQISHGKKFPADPSLGTFWSDQPVKEANVQDIREVLGEPLTSKEERPKPGNLTEEEHPARNWGNNYRNIETVDQSIQQGIGETTAKVIYI